MDCKMCGGPLAALGSLGSMFWVRCVNCGSQQGLVIGKDVDASDLVTTDEDDDEGCPSCDDLFATVGGEDENYG